MLFTWGSVPGSGPLSSGVLCPWEGADCYPGGWDITREVWHMGPKPWSREHCLTCTEWRLQGHTSALGLSHPQINGEFGLLRQKSLGLYLRYLDSCCNSWIARVRKSKILFRSSVSLHSDPLQKLFGKFLLKSANRFQVTKTASPMQKFIKTHKSHRPVSILQRCYYH